MFLDKQGSDRVVSSTFEGDDGGKYWSYKVLCIESKDNVVAIRNAASLPLIPSDRTNARNDY